MEIGANVRGYIFRTNGQHVYIAGEVVGTHTWNGVLMVQVLRADNGRTATVYAAHVEEITVRPVGEIEIIPGVLLVSIPVSQILPSGRVITRAEVVAEMRRTHNAPAPERHFSGRGTRSVSELI